MIQAFITKRKSPKDKIVAGNVSSTRIGFITASNIANTTATATAVKILLFTMATPGKMYARTKTFTVLIKIFNKNFIVVKLQLARKNLRPLNIFLIKPATLQQKQSLSHSLNHKNIFHLDHSV